MTRATWPGRLTFVGIICAHLSCTAGVSEDMNVCGSARYDYGKHREVLNQGTLQEHGSESRLHQDGGNSQTKTTNVSFRHDSRFRGEYTFAVEQMSRMKCSDPKVMDFFHKESPVILEGCAFAKPALKWNLEFLKENLRDENHALFISPNRKFLYFDEDVMKGKFETWRPPTEKRQAYFEEFLQIVDHLQKANNGSYAYFQSPLILRDGVSSTMKDDVNSFDYSWLLDVVVRMGWGEDVVNLLLVGMPNVVTPAHYDILQNLFVQLSGRKRCILFSPEFYRGLYPFPVGHPHDRQTQVDFDGPDFENFPNFRDVRGLEAVVEPGEVLYIPSYWWHYIESEKNNMTISLNFWFEPTNSTAASAGESQSQREKSREKDENENGEETGEEEQGEVEETFLSPQEELALMRNVEISLFKATHDHDKVRQMLETILTGRFNHWNNSSSQ